ncbi:hypothetical protein HI914_02118 [Erysiphe necator]|nr:hypothetical protein HI914_02118 [Erysiphe necator]
MNSQSSGGLVLVNAQSDGHTQSSSLSSLSSTPGASSPIIYPSDVAPTSKIFSITPPPSSYQDSARSKKLASLVGSSSPVAEMKIGAKEQSIISGRPTPDLIETATKDELQKMLKISLDEILKLEAASCEARMSAAHHKLHYNLLSIESQEALNRMEVENYMLRRETLILRKNPQNQAQTQYKKMLEGYCKYLKEENLVLHYRLKKAKSLIKRYDLKLASAFQEINLLQDRIRQNRRYINEMRRPGGPLLNTFTSLSHTEISKDSCTHYYNNMTQKNSHLHPKPPDLIPENREKLDVLLLAGSILDQENNKISSPIMANYGPPDTKQLQNQGLQAICQPEASCPSQISNALLPPIRLQIQVDKTLKSPLRTSSQLSTRRRKSRDSTISVSECDEQSASQKNENKVPDSDILFKQVNASCSKNKVGTKLANEKLCNDNQELYNSLFDTVMTKRRREDELSWWNIESKKSRHNEILSLTNA